MIYDTHFYLHLTFSGQKDKNLFFQQGFSKSWNNYGHKHVCHYLHTAMADMDLGTSLSIIQGQDYLPTYFYVFSYLSIILCCSHNTCVFRCCV